ncbi:MAG: hypothetical protein EOP56_14595 [Sphingobacteriales bacterium]|nr:MAG: hypothetical protein EOP56_14595 [Sphingobacteriales bacterium]
MKKLSLLLGLTLSFTVGYAQSSGQNHRIYNTPESKTPVVLTKLGTDPQFLTLRNLKTSDEVYDKIKAMSSNAKYRNEMNGLLTSLGYSGINDPSFDRSDIKAADVPFGAMGMLGSGGHTYKYSMIAVPNQPAMKAWYIAPANGDEGLYFMSACGNAFHYANAARVVERERVVKEYVQAEPAKLKVNVYARYKGDDCISWCDDCDVPGFADAPKEQKVLLAEEKIVEIPTGGSSYPVKNVYIDVDKKTFKRIRYAPDNNTGWIPDDAYAGTK